MDHERRRGQRFITERHLQFIWYNRLFSPRRLLTEEGRNVEILSPGMPNLEGGPDFRNARLVFDGIDPPAVGDVEIHLFSSGWEEHGHHDDPAYANVVLHVALWRSGESRRRNVRAFPIPEVILESYLTESIHALVSAIPPSGHIERFDDSSIDHDAILVLGRATLERKVERFRLLTASLGGEEALYRGIMSALGYRKNKSQFEDLARRTPCRSLRDAADADGIERMLLDSGKTIPWRRAGVRPSNRPETRIRGMALLLAEAFRRGGVERWLVGDLARGASDGLFQEEKWARAAVRRLREASGGAIGIERGWMIVVNILFPYITASDPRVFSVDRICAISLATVQGARRRFSTVAEHLGNIHFKKNCCSDRSMVYTVRYRGAEVTSCKKQVARGWNPAPAHLGVAVRDSCMDEAV